MMVNEPGSLARAGAAVLLALATVLAAQDAGDAGDAGDAADAAGAGETQEPGPERLSELATRSLVARYEEADLWALRGIVLLALGPDWHPCASAIVRDALASGDEPLQAFALEALRRTSTEALPAVLTAELVEELVRKQLRVSNPLYRGRVLGVLARGFPGAERTSRAAWERWWRGVRADYAPADWSAPEEPEGGGSMASTSR